MAAQLVRKCSQPFWLVATARQFTVGAALSQKVEDPVKKLFLDKMKVCYPLVLMLLVGPFCKVKG